MKILIAMVLVVLLVACGRAEPVATDDTTNPKVTVDLLFEHDGCKVYRFKDSGNYRYFVNCPDRTTMMSGHNVVCGKNCVRHVTEEIPTEY